MKGQEKHQHQKFTPKPHHKPTVMRRYATVPTLGQQAAGALLKGIGDYMISYRCDHETAYEDLACRKLNIRFKAWDGNHYDVLPIVEDGSVKGIEPVPIGIGE